MGSGLLQTLVLVFGSVAAVFASLWMAQKHQAVKRLAEDAEEALAALVVAAQALDDVVADVPPAPEA